MSQTRLVRLNQIVDGTGATVEVQLDADGSVLAARFVLDGMPRIEPLLVGRPVANVPGIVERLCGICPTSHHLAGIRALEALTGAPRLTTTAALMRRLLHHGSVLRTHAQALTPVDATRARDLGAFALQVQAAAGADSHFPRCAVLGGVLAPLLVERRDELAGQVASAVASACWVLGRIERRACPGTAPYQGHDLALVDRHGALDLYGDRLRAVAADGTVTVDGATPEDWVELVAEASPGSAAPRPHLRALGPGPGSYRVGPVAQLRASTQLSTPLAEEARQRWTTGRGGTTWARAVVAVHAVEVIGGLLSRPELVAGPVLSRGDTPDPATRREGSGWVDGARGLLVHTYRTEGGGILSDATITTPTAQNETWLADLLHDALESCHPDRPASVPSGAIQVRLEAAIRAADPCLPCTSSTPGLMQVRLQLQPPREAAVARGPLADAAVPER